MGWWGGGTAGRPESRTGADADPWCRPRLSVWDVDNSLLVSLGIWRIGLAGKASLGPIWMAQQTPRSPRDAGRPDAATRKREIARFFRPQLERLLADYDFDMLVAGHGPAIERGAKGAVRARMDSQLPADFRSSSGDATGHS